jgi:uncharacterized protein YbcV (DUF1398 family)
MPTVFSTMEINAFWVDIFSANKFPFRFALAKLAPLGVTRYQIDFVSRSVTTYSGPLATTSGVGLLVDAGTNEWDENRLKTAISDAASGRINFAEFCGEIAVAGVVNYFASLETRRVIYMGKNMETSIEHL